MKDEPQRKLESQPLQQSNNPLTSSSGDRLRKHRFGRPNTNSPFPNINNNRINKNQQQNHFQFLPPTTAATSSKNQMASEQMNISNNQLESSFSYGPSFVPSYNQSFLNSYNEVGSYYQQNIDEERYISQSFYQQTNLGEIPPYDYNSQIAKSIIQQTKPNLLRESFQKSPLKQMVPQVTEQRIIRKSLARSKIQSEPNSPKQQIFDSQPLPRPANGSKIIIPGSQTRIDGQLRLSVNKMALFKNQHQGSKQLKQQHQQKLKKKFANCSAEGSDIQGCLTPSSESSSQQNKTKNGFLPKLERNNRDLNSQVLYIDLQNKNKHDLKERVDISTKSPTNNWIKEQDYKTSGVGLERRKPVKTDTHYQYTPGSTTISNQFELSPEFLKNPKGLSHYYQSKNIGKIQPIHELKMVINEQVIRQKLNRGNINYNNENSSMLNINHQGIMSEVVSPKNSPLSTRQMDSSRVIRGRALFNEPNKRLNQEIINEDNNITLSKFFQQRSGSQCSNLFEASEGNQIDDKLLTQFHQRTNSVNQVQKVKGLNIQGIHTHQQFNTIEDVMSNSKGLAHQQQQQYTEISAHRQSQQYGGDTSSSKNDSILNIHLPIKTVASKQMPKCFRMSKNQIKQVHKAYKHHEGSKIGLQQQTQLFLNERKYEHNKNASFSNMFVHNNNNNNNNFGNHSNRVDLELQTALQIKGNGGGGYNQDLYREKIMETEEEERARMTPAFNERNRESFSFVQ